MKKDKHSIEVYQSCLKDNKNQRKKNRKNQNMSQADQGPELRGLTQVPNPISLSKVNSLASLKSKRTVSAKGAAICGHHGDRIKSLNQSVDKLKD